MYTYVNTWMNRWIVMLHPRVCGRVFVVRPHPYLCCTHRMVFFARPPSLTVARTDKLPASVDDVVNLVARMLYPSALLGVESLRSIPIESCCGGPNLCLSSSRHLEPQQPILPLPARLLGPVPNVSLVAVRTSHLHTTYLDPYLVLRNAVGSMALLARRPALRAARPRRRRRRLAGARVLLLAAGGTEPPEGPPGRGARRSCAQSSNAIKLSISRRYACTRSPCSPHPPSDPESRAWRRSWSLPPPAHVQQRAADRVVLARQVHHELPPRALLVRRNLTCVAESSPVLGSWYTIQPLKPCGVGKGENGESGAVFTPSASSESSRMSPTRSNSAHVFFASSTATSAMSRRTCSQSHAHIGWRRARTRVCSRGARAAAGAIGSKALAIDTYSLTRSKISNRSMQRLPRAGACSTR